MTRQSAAVALVLLAIQVQATAAAADEDGFREQVAPIFEEHCVRCHSGARPKGSLDLTTRQGVLTGGESGPAVAPGRLEDSLLPAFISGDEPAMPQGGDPLPREHVAAIERWIARGAVWPEGLVLKDRSRWWSLSPLNRPAVPSPRSQPSRSQPSPRSQAPPGNALREALPRVNQAQAVATERAAWPRTPVDAFILARQREQGLFPSEPADRRTRLRRLTFDLHGLPPRPEEIDEFVADPSPAAWHKQVDRLLASPRYGERWARHWLDVVHYGDTHGYDKDKRRPNAWPYRDYVIRSLNEDQPYRQFVWQQLAGDVPLEASSAGRAATHDFTHREDWRNVAATGFIVAGPWDFVGHVELREGTTDKEITRSLDRDDMVMNAMSTFTSLTVHCARCHDHKFDPITQDDYYSLQAVFAGVERADRSFDASPSVARQRRALLAGIAEHERRLQALESLARRRAGAELAEVEARLSALSADTAQVRPPEYGYHSAIEPRADVTKWVQVDLGRPVAIDRIVLIGCHDDFAGIGAGFGFPVRYRVEVAADAEFQRGGQVVIDRTTGDVPNPGTAPQEIDASGRTARFVRVTATKLAPRQNDFICALAELQVFTLDGTNAATGAAVSALDSIEAPVRWRKSNLVDGLYAGHEDTDRRREAKELERRRDELLAAALTPEQREERASGKAALAALRGELAALPPQSMVYAAATEFSPQGAFTPPPDGRPRPIHVLHRGSVTSPGEPAAPGTVSCVAGLPARFALADPDDGWARRAALAEWIIDPRNALTWRSIANRVWHYHFGRGIVETPNDFGRMGARPTHPQLLEWLAVEMRPGSEERGPRIGDRGLKHLHRLLVTSAVYQQSSGSGREAHRADAPEPHAAAGESSHTVPRASRASPADTRSAIDAANLSLWRMNRRRLEAEAVRDAVLAVSGQLRQTMYGPGFDLFEFEDDHSPRYLYQQHDVDNPAALRRTVYRFVVRSVPDPFLETLDCPDPSLNTARRNTTITALQALALLNNRFMVRQAEHFADRIAATATDLDARIEAACVLSLGRRPQPDEAARLAAYAAEHGLPNLCRVLFNTNEFLFVD